jgi:HEAT repeat protein
VNQRPGNKRTQSKSKIIASLISQLASTDGYVRQTARLSLVDIGKPALKPLIELLNDKHEQIRWEAVKALAQIADPSTACVLVRTLEDKIFDIRWLAAGGLIAMGTYGLAPLLGVLIEQNKPDWLWQGAHHVIHDLAKGDLEPLLQPLLTALDDIDAHLQVPLIAKAILDRLGSQLKDSHKSLSTY